MTPMTLHNKTYLVTGGASGLGLGCVHQLCRHGANVIIADVNQSNGIAVLDRLKSLYPNAILQFVQVDLSDPRSVEHLCVTIKSRISHLDGLVNNAGIYPPSQRKLAASGRELCFEIAFTGHYRLTLNLLELLEKADAPAVVTVSSLVQKHAQIYFDDLSLSHEYTPIQAYAQAKLSNLLFATELQRRLSRRGSKVRSYAAHPGVCRTSLGAHRPHHASDSLWQRMSSFVLAHGLAHFGQSPENGARPLMAPILDASIPPGTFLGPRGPFQAFGKPAPMRLGKAAQSLEAAHQLWMIGERATGLSLS